MKPKIDYDALFAFTKEGPFYLGIGGIGDLFLCIAVCLEKNITRLIFWSTTGFSHTSQKICDDFSISHFIMGIKPSEDVCAMFAWRACFRHKNLAAAPFAPADLKYLSWSNIRPEELAEKLVFTLPGKDIFGTIQRNESPIVCIAPRGSSDTKRIYPDEFYYLVDAYLERKWKVYVVGTDDDMKLYGERRCTWINTDFIHTPDKSYSIDANTMLKIINSADLVISVDTWVKTYSCLLGIPTIVFKCRTQDRENFFHNAAGDVIFLNLDFWKTMVLVSIEEFLQWNDKPNTLQQMLVPTFRLQRPEDRPSLPHC